MRFVYCQKKIFSNAGMHILNCFWPKFMLIIN